VSRDPFMVVPTLGNRPSLWPLLADAGMAAMVIWTGPVDADPIRAFRAEHPRADVTFVVDHGPIDIHRWWLKGMDLAASRGMGVAVVVNDDVRAAPGALRVLADQVVGETVLAYLDRPEHAATRVTPITGWCFALRSDRSLMLEPSECTKAYEFPPGQWGCPHHVPQLRWWFGDHEIELRARHYPGRSVRAVQGLQIEHLRQGWLYDRPTEVSPLIAADTALFRHRHPELGV
jgi:hypothetical protein